MIEVKVADIVEQRREDKDTGDSWPIHVDAIGGRAVAGCFPYGWERPKAERAAGLANLEAPRPLTFSFVANLLGAADVQVEDVRIDSLKGDTYYAVVTLGRGDSPWRRG